MSILRENIVYTILALVAIVLIGVTIGLQLVIITGQNPTVLTGAAQQATQQPLDSSGSQVAFAVTTVTETPAVLIIQPAPIGDAQNNAAAETQNNAALESANGIAPAAPAEQGQTVPADQNVIEPAITTAAPAPAQQLPIDTPTDVESTIAISATSIVTTAVSPTLAPPTPVPPTPVPPTPVPPTPIPPTPATPTASAVPLVEPTVPPAAVESGAFRIGYANRGYGCPIVSQIVERILEERLETTVALINFDTVESMFLAVANNEADITLCYLDPDDRALLRGDNKRTIGFKMAQLGSQYWETEGQKLQMWVNLSTMGELRTAERACMLNLFYSLRFAERDLQTVDVDGWLTTHAAEIDEWVNCES